MDSPFHRCQVSFPRVQGRDRDAKGNMTSHILVSCGLLRISQLCLKLRTWRMRTHFHRSGSLSSLERGVVTCSSSPCPGFLGLLDPCRHSKLNSKPRQSEQGELEGKWGGGVERGVRMESKSGEVCSPLVCNFQNDSRTGQRSGSLRP